MTFVHDLLLLLHFVGFASLFGGFFVQIRSTAPVLNSAILHGALTQLVTGVLLVGLAESVDEYVVDNAKIAVKLGVVLVITVLALLNRKKPAIPRGLLFTIGALTLANAAVAVFWH